MTIQTDKLKPETVEYLSRFPEALENAINIGVYVLSSVQTSKDMDVVKEQVKNLMDGVKNTFEQLELKYGNIIETSTKSQIEGMFNVDIPTSYPKKFGEFMNNTAREFNGELSALLEKITSEASRIEKHTSEEDGSVFDRMKKAIGLVDEFIQKNFNDTNTEGFAFKAKLMMEDLLGKVDARMTELIRKETSESMKPLTESVNALRELVAEEKGKAEVFELTTAKGFAFEEELMFKLEEVAKPNGDVVQNTALLTEVSGSKKGDFLYTLSGSGTKIVIEAKDKETVSLKNSLDYMKQTMTERVVSFGILVAKSPEQLQKQIGRWNIYDNVIICCADDIEMTLRTARVLLQMRSVKQGEGINIGEIETKMKKIMTEMKRFAAVKSKLTNISTSISTSTTEIKNEIESIQEDVLNAVSDVETELRNAA